MTNTTERLSLNEKLNLIKTRASLMRFRRHDLEDAVQDVMLAVLEFEYEPEKPDGGSEATALTTIIDRKLISLNRAKRRYTGLIERATNRLSAEYQGCEDGPFAVDHGGESRVVSNELSDALEGLDSETLQVARLLMEGLSTKGIAEELDMGWHRADRHVALIRLRLEEAGITHLDAE